MCSRSQAAQKGIMQQLDVQERHISFLQTLHNVRPGKPQIAFLAFLSSSI
jgi:hypothetical protein